MKSLKVVAAIIKSGDKYLCTERGVSKYPYNSYKWEFPGGKIENGETNEKALKREIMEELGIEIDVKGYFCGVNYIYPDFDLTMYTYDCEALSTDIKLNVHKDYKWLTISELNTLDWASADKLVLSKIIQEDKKRK